MPYYCKRYKATLNTRITCEARKAWMETHGDTPSARGGHQTEVYISLSPCRHCPGATLAQPPHHSSQLAQPAQNTPPQRYPP